ncbi:DISARM system phospholipase D-like protein DrmC [Streptomyces sp. NPDC056004]|uniref:DISARM system phospholipase D-like protein DrmC n=1 Tax=unclassified Streptomyces TaxID=2593676 RepID=UPI0035E327DB
MPARFLIACPAGHMDDFPWQYFVHRGGAPAHECTLSLVERGTTGEAANIFVQCSCPNVADRSMAEAMGKRGEQELPACRGHHPHLGTFDTCGENVRTIALGATNSWLSTLRKAWRDESPQLPGSALALSLATAAAAEENTDPSAGLVVSGPTSPAIPVRLTNGIAVDVIRSACESLLIASFAAYGITEIVTELRAASERNVRIDLLLEEPTAAARAFGPLGDQVRIRHRAGGTGHTSLHAKVTAADRHTALLGRANLTGRGLSRNVEIGVILRDSRAVGRLVDHLRWPTGPEGLLRRS